MKEIITNDGSITLYSEEYNECFHTKSGALEESFKKFIEPCKLRLGSKILDIGFGLGYNSLAAIHSVKNVSIIALEKDKKILRAVQSIQVPNYIKEHFQIIKKVAKNLHYEDNNFKIKIILGDATKTIKTLNESFDAVFLDPFSPPKNPELWTVEFLKNVRKLMKKNAILATYSYARKVRENLSKVGFSIGDGPIIGRRSPSTLAANL